MQPSNSFAVAYLVISALFVRKTCSLNFLGTLPTLVDHKYENLFLESMLYSIDLPLYPCTTATLCEVLLFCFKIVFILNSLHFSVSFTIGLSVPVRDC